MHTGPPELGVDLYACKAEVVLHTGHVHPGTTVMPVTSSLCEQYLLIDDSMNAFSGHASTA